MIFVWPLIFVFVLLDLSTAFNTVDLDFFLQPLEHTIDIKAITLQLFELYLRLKFVHANGESFSYAKVHYGVPQGSQISSMKPDDTHYFISITRMKAVFLIWTSG